MFRLLRRMPLFRLLAIARTALLAREHIRRLDAGDRLLGKLEPRAFAFATADTFSPVPIPRFLAGRRRRSSK